VSCKFCQNSFDVLEPFPSYPKNHFIKSLPRCVTLPINPMHSFIPVATLNAHFYVSHVSVYVQSVAVLIPEMSYLVCSYLQILST